MKSIAIKDLMVPLEEYATVNEDATFKEALQALEKAQQEFDQSRYRHRAVLVLNENKQVVGKISMFDVIRALEPKYSNIEEVKSPSRSGYSPEFLMTMMEEHVLWDQSFDTLLNNASHLKVKNFMYVPTKGEYIDEDATFGEAIHILVMGHHHSLLIIKNNKISGILRATDIFKMICDEI